MRHLFGCPDIVSLTDKFLMARNFFWIFTENNPVMGSSKTFVIPEAKGLKLFKHVIQGSPAFFNRELNCNWQKLLQVARINNWL